jgi:hypothetical protein
VSLGELPEIQATRAAVWRARSRAGFAVDSVVLVLGCVLLLCALADSVVSWPADDVLISAPDLERLGAIILVPSWIWILASGVILFGFRNKRGTTDWKKLKPGRALLKRPMVLAFFGLALLVFFVIVVGFVIGAAKGSLRILPEGVHQVSTLDLNNADWTTVTPHEYQVWDARFVREDALFGYFALFMIGGSLYFHRLHRRSARLV